MQTMAPSKFYDSVVKKSWERVLLAAKEQLFLGDFRIQD